MVFWILIAGMTGLAVLAVLVPMARSRAVSASVGASDADIYKDQLTEIGREVERGVITADEAESAKIEVSRRLLHAAGPEAAVRSSSPLALRLASVMVLVLVPVIALGSYLLLGSPDLPSMPAAERRARSVEQQDVQTLLVRVEAHLASNPADGRGWELIAPVYARFGRYQEAAAAYGRAIALLGSDADRQSGLGESLMRVAGGIITQDARTAFEAALAADPASPRARYYLALAAYQDGRKDDAIRQLRALVASAEPGAPWLRLVEGELARMTGAAADAPAAQSPAAAPGPAAADVAAAQNMSPTERAAMVQGMVDRLSARLKENADDPDGWVRLIRAYTVMGDRTRANEALISARTALVSRPQALASLDELAASLGLGPQEKQK